MSTQLTDISGRPWAKLSDLHPGDVVEFDDGFTCLRKGEIALVHVDLKGQLFVFCSGHEEFEGRSKKHSRKEQHFLDGQADDGEHCVGVYKI